MCCIQAWTDRNRFCFLIEIFFSHISKVDDKYFVENFLHVLIEYVFFLNTAKFVLFPGASTFSLVLPSAAVMIGDSSHAIPIEKIVKAGQCGERGRYDNCYFTRSLRPPYFIAGALRSAEEDFFSR